MRPADGIRVSMLIEVEPALAFEVFTEDVDLWWKRGIAYRVRGKRPGTMRFEPGVGGRLVEAWGDEPGDMGQPGEHEIGRILVWDPGVRLAFEYRGPNFEPDQCTEVDVRFEASASGTLVTLEHSGWDGLPHDHPVRHGLPREEFLGMWGGLWTDQLRVLRSCGRARNESR